MTEWGHPLPVLDDVVDHGPVLEIRSDLQQRVTHFQRKQTDFSFIEHLHLQGTWISGLNLTSLGIKVYFYTGRHHSVAD